MSQHFAYVVFGLISCLMAVEDYRNKKVSVDYFVIILPIVIVIGLIRVLGGELSYIGGLISIVIFSVLFFSYGSGWKFPLGIGDCLFISMNVCIFGFKVVGIWLMLSLVLINIFAMIKSIAVRNLKMYRHQTRIPFISFMMISVLVYVIGLWKGFL